MKKTEPDVGNIYSATDVPSSEPVLTRQLSEMTEHEIRKQRSFLYVKKEGTDICDIYRAADAPPEAAPVRQLSEMVEREIRKQRLFYLFASLLTLLLLVFLVLVLIYDYLSFLPQPVEPPVKKASFIQLYTLPENERWALEYRQVADIADAGKALGPKTVSSSRVKNSAYHIIMGEQALRIDDLDAAQIHFEKALEIFPGMKDTRRALGTVYLKQQRFGPAAEALQQALEEDPSFDVIVNLGVACIGTGEYSRAEKLLKQALALQPGFAGCYKNLALLYQKTGDTAQAESNFEAYFATRPEDVDMIRIYADYLTGLNRTAASVLFLERMQTTDALPVYLLLAKTAAKTGDETRAVRALEKVAQRLPPRLTLVEMNDEAFKKISRTAAFEELTRRLELAVVSLSADRIETNTN